MTNRELLKIIQEISEGEGLNLTGIADKARMDRSHLSTFLNMDVEKEVSKLMMGKLKKHFLKYFPDQQVTQQKPQGTTQNEKFLSGEISLTAQEYVDELKRDKERLERLLEDTQRVISTNLTALMQLMSAVHRHDLAFHETQLQALARLENKKDPPDLVEKANIRETELMVEEMKAGKMSYVEGR